MKLGTFWVILGRIGSILGQKSALPKLLKNTIVLYAFSVFNAYFTVSNAPNDRMTHPWKTCSAQFDNTEASQPAEN